MALTAGQLTAVEESSKSTVSHHQKEDRDMDMERLKNEFLRLQDNLANYTQRSAENIKEGIATYAKAFEDKCKGLQDSARDKMREAYKAAIDEYEEAKQASEEEAQKAYETLVKKMKKLNEHLEDETHADSK